MLVFDILYSEISSVTEAENHLSVIVYSIYVIVYRIYLMVPTDVNHARRLWASPYSHLPCLYVPWGGGGVCSTHFASSTSQFNIASLSMQHKNLQVKSAREICWI